MRVALICLLLSGCVFTSCSPWIPDEPKEIMPTQTTFKSIADEFPDIGLGLKCHY
jgi:hypothetical protein